MIRKNHDFDGSFLNLLDYEIMLETAAPLSAGSLVRLLERRRVKTYVAGGAVRDVIRGETPRDIDFVAAAPIATLRAILAQTFGDQVLLIYNEALGSLRFGASHDNYVDIGMFRDIASIADAKKLGDVHWAYSGEPLADALTTDFTVNALYWRQEEGLIDPLGRGISDCLSGILAIAADARKAELDFRLTLRLALFACRGLRADDEALAFFRRRIDGDVLAFGAALAGYLDELTRGSPSLKHAIIQFAADNGA